jgi:hypothetical protein
MEVCKGGGPGEVSPHSFWFLVLVARMSDVGGKFSVLFKRREELTLRNSGGYIKSIQTCLVANTASL